jgi:hypothetical protein
MKTKRSYRLAVLLAWIGNSVLAGCGTPTPQATPELIRVHVSQSLQPWLEKAYDCAREGSGVLYLVDEDAAEVTLRLGEPEALALPSYQIGEEELLVVAHRDSPLQNLSLAEAENLFAGRGDPTIQVWVYSRKVDVQQIFDRDVMKGRPITSNGRLAVSPKTMQATLSNDINSVGILTRAWMTDALRELTNLGKYPVLAISRVKPEGEINQLIGCLQR